MRNAWVHLFQGRYKAILVDAESYLLELVRYIHLNPVRAGLVQDPGDYLWSGQRTCLGQETLPWLATEWVLGQFARHLDTARRRYEAFVLEGRNQEYQGEFHRGPKDPRLLGDDRLMERVAQQEKVRRRVPPLDGVVRAVCQEYDITYGLLRDLGELVARLQVPVVDGLMERGRAGEEMTAVSDEVIDATAEKHSAFISTAWTQPGVGGWAGPECPPPVRSGSKRRRLID